MFVESVERYESNVALFSRETPASAGLALAGVSRLNEMRVR